MKYNTRSNHLFSLYDSELVFRNKICTMFNFLCPYYWNKENGYSNYYLCYYDAQDCPLHRLLHWNLSTYGTLKISLLYYLCVVNKLQRIIHEGLFHLSGFRNWALKHLNLGLLRIQYSASECLFTSSWKSALQIGSFIIHMIYEFIYQ